MKKTLSRQKEEKVLTDLAMHKVSIGKAAKMCSVSLWRMLALVKEKNTDWTGYDDEDLQKDIALLQ